MHTEMRRPTLRWKRPSITPLAQRSRPAVGAVGTLILVALVAAAFSYDKLPLIKRTADYSAYFAEAGGIKPGSEVRVSGLEVGMVGDVTLAGTQVLARQGLYGDYFGFYLCDAVLKLNGKGGEPVYTKLAGQDTGRCTPK